MNLWEYTSDELIGAAQVFPDPVSAPEEPMQWDARNIELISEVPGYATAPAWNRRGFADQVLLEREGRSWTCVGYYVDDTIIVFARAQNCGLADILFLRCIENRDELPITTNLTESGMRLFKRVYENEVRKAKKAGLRVPEEVLREFPD